MSVFKLNLEATDGSVSQIMFDSEHTKLFNIDGSDFKLPVKETLEIVPNIVNYAEAPVYEPGKVPVIRNKDGVFSDIRIFLGAKCNFNCVYCYQNDVRENEVSFRMQDVDPFFEDLDKWYSGAGAVRTKYGREFKFLDGRDTKVQFWGGEPLVYWKIVKKLVEGLKARFPKIKFGMVSNGSLLTDEIADFIINNDFHISVSHDGPGQYLRGPDPLDDPVASKAILKLHDAGLLFFNPTLSVKSYSKYEIIRYLENKTKRGFKTLGEGDFIELFNPNDETTKSLMMNDSHIAHTVARVSHTEYIQYPEISRLFTSVQKRIASLLGAFYTNRNQSTFGTKCTMDKKTTMVLNRDGEMLLCHHGSRGAKENSCGSKTNVRDIENNELHVAYHWKTKSYCQECPIIALCSGSCPFTTGSAHETNCRTTYYDLISIFGYTIKLLTGKKLLSFEPIGPNSFSEAFPDRLDPFGYRDDENNKIVFKSKIIPIKQVS